ncbi:hypothetical protein J1605_004537 [Eschrichtius robustus]|uniref:Uncharacterized protein n=1 Tax=Eschrichtius robustus TaxID=9764 RepID=A0AB34HJ27_ESCRO|nr:hypothetical protein J1605_004537 [Eschrichtius robustus]
MVDSPGYRLPLHWITVRKPGTAERSAEPNRAVGFQEGQQKLQVAEAESPGAEDSEASAENPTEDPNPIVDQKYKEPGGKNLDRGVPPLFI